MPILTHCDLSSRKGFSKLIAGSEKLKHSAVLRNILCEIELNAFARSKKIAAVFSPFSWFSITDSLKNNAASVEDFLFWNPNFSLFKIVFINVIHHLEKEKLLKKLSKSWCERNWSIVAHLCC